MYTYNMGYGVGLEETWDSRGLDLLEPNNGNECI